MPILHVKGIDGYYGTGDNIDITVTVDSGTLTATGTPQVLLLVGGLDVYADLLSVSGQEAVFRYTVSAGHNADLLTTQRLVQDAANKLLLNGVDFIEELPENDDSRSLAQQSTIVVDTLSPTVRLVSPVTSLPATITDPVVIDAWLSEPVNSFDALQCVAVNCTVDSITADVGNNRHYTITVTPTGGNATLTAGAGTFVDYAGNSSSVSNSIALTQDSTIPVVSAPVPDSLYSYQGTCSWHWEAATDDAGVISAYKVEVVNVGTSAVVETSDLPGSARSYLFNGSNGATYKLRLAAVDLAGNVSSFVDSTNNVVCDTQRPTPVLTTSVGAITNEKDVIVDVDFGEAVVNFYSDDVSVVNGSIAGFTKINDSQWKIYIKPEASGTVTVVINANSVFDLSANGCNRAETSFTFDDVRPTCVITTPKSVVNTANIDFTIKFSEAVSNFIATDITLTGANVVGLSGSGDTYTLSVTATAAEVICTVPANVCNDAASNVNYQSNTVTVAYDSTNPAISNVTSNSENGTYYLGDKLDVRVQFSKPVYVNGGVPRLLMNTGRPAYYLTGSGSSTLIFVYTVTYGDNIADLDYTSNVAFELYTSTITDAANNSADISLAMPGTAGSLGANKAIAVDGSSYGPSGATFNDYCGYSGLGSPDSELTAPTNYIRSGVGDSSDLKVSLEAVNVAGSGSRWYPIIRKGWFYDRNEERYLYARRGISKIVGAVKNAAYNVNFTGTDMPADEVSAYGPVLVTATGLQFMQVSSPLRVFKSYVPNTQVSGYADRFSVVVTGLPVEILRHDARDPMRKVQSVDAITDEHEYCVVASVVDNAGEYSTVYTVTVAGQDTLYVTQTTPTDDTHPYWLNEMCVIDANRQIRATYANVSSNTNHTAHIYSLKEGVYSDSDSSAVGSWSGNVFTFSDSASYQPGDRVGLTYFVNNSYVLTSTGVQVYVGTDVASDLSIYYECSTDTHWRDAKLLDDVYGNYSESAVQLNPIYSGNSPGFLYIQDTDEGVVDSVNLTIDVSPTYALVDQAKSTGQPIRVKARLTDSSGNPISGVPIMCNYNSNYLRDLYIYPEDRVSNWMGEVTVVLQPKQPGEVTISITAGTVTKIATVHLQEYTTKVTAAASTTDLIQKLYLQVTNESVYKGTVRLRAYATTSDGACPASDIPVQFVSRSSKFANTDYTREGSTQRALVQGRRYDSSEYCDKLYTDLHGHAVNDYYLSGHDVVFAVYTNSAGTRRVFSNFIVMGGSNE